MSDNISANGDSRHHKENPLRVLADIQNVADYAPNAISEGTGHEQLQRSPPAVQSRVSDRGEACCDARSNNLADRRTFA
jgi:hypothetical protein